MFNGQCAIQNLKLPHFKIGFYNYRFLVNKIHFQTAITISEFAVANAQWCEFQIFCLVKHG